MRHLLFDMYHIFYLTNAAHCVIVISIHIVHCSTGRGDFSIRVPLWRGQTTTTERRWQLSLFLFAFDQTIIRKKA